MQSRAGWFLAGLFLTTLATLSLEILNTRLLSVLTWYHLSFLAVSMAMFGMSAGAVHVYLGGSRFEGERARGALARYGLLFTLSIPLSHIVNLLVPIQSEISVMNVAALAVTTVVLAVPFYVSGILVAVALTRIPGPSGLIYAVDLVGASIGCLLIVPLLRASDVSSAAIVIAAVGALGAAAFQRHARPGGGRWAAGVAVLLVAAAIANGMSLEGLRVAYPKGRVTPKDEVVDEFWTIHGQVALRHGSDKPFFWGRGKGVGDVEVESMRMAIDGAAGTVMTRWDGDPDSIGWVAHDVTALPYHLRKGGEVAVIGVGGGRDLLTALWARSRKVTGIEINEAFIELLTGDYRDYANLATREEVTLVHDEARSYLTRSADRYDVLQMSLIDTWAATGAGAFTLSENGLYTTDGWRVFLERLKPDGIFSVSRWYSPKRASETSRLLSVAVASLLERGVTQPADHLALVSRQAVATLLVSTQPLSRDDAAAIREAAREYGFTVLLLRGRGAGPELLKRIVTVSSLEDLERVVANEPYDYSPVDDQRPYFFNILRPGSVLETALATNAMGVIAEGNLQATRSLVALWALSLLLVVTIILGPLWRAGLPSLDGPSFAYALAYFAAIGLGFMLVQIPLMQRFSVYLGHPTYSVAVILFSMILAAGIGSWLSDRVGLENRPHWLVAGPVWIVATLLLLVVGIQPVIDATIERELAVRCTIVVALVGAAALPMGFCFPIGLRLVRRLADDAMPWMWGVNGACGVLASVSAVGISMWSGIHTNLMVAAAAYAFLVLAGVRLWQRGGATDPR